MAKVSPQIKDIDSAIGLEQEPLTFLPRVSAPFTTVVNRAPVTNFAADGLPKFGVERIMTQGIVEVQGEQGPNGERVWKPINDVHNAVRLVGGWASNINSFGQYSGTSGAAANTDYVEITFYGTGLNLFIIPANGNTRTFAVSVNGGSSTSVQWDSASNSNVINGRNYSSNVVFNVVSGLTLGLHTARIQQNNGTNFYFYGHEVLNTSASIFLPQTTSYIGGRRLFQNSTGTMSPTTGFESGTLGTRGGHVLVYQKSDGTIAKAVTPTNAAAAFLSSADHTNEEEIRRYHWREFGAGRTDDFSSLISSSNRAFTLDDGTTTLVGSSVSQSNDFLLSVASGGFWTLTFVGTGLDIIRQDTSTAALDQHTVSVDGASVGTFTGAGNTSTRVQRICSGLPYGTHTVRLTRDAFVNQAVTVSQFIVYGPKTPTLPAGAVALADYYVMGDYAAAATSTRDVVSAGVLRKLGTRENVYSGTFGAVSQSTSFNSGFVVATGVATSFGQYTFFGTGIEYRGFVNNAEAQNFTILVDGLALNAGSNVGSSAALVSTGTTGLSLSAAGVVTGTATGGGTIYVRITGLSLGLHTIRITQNTTTSLYFDAFDIITPIHSPKVNQPGDLQNTLPVGSCAIGDMRKFSAVAVKPLTNWAQAVGVTSSPTTTSTTAPGVPMPEMSLTLKTTGNPVQISFAAYVNNVTAQAAIVSCLINGVSLGAIGEAVLGGTSTDHKWVSNTFIVPLSAGVHKIDLYWYMTGSGTISNPGIRRTLTAREL